MNTVDKPADDSSIANDPQADLPPVPAARPNPSKLRFAAIMVVAVYPLITTLLYVIGPLTIGWEVWHRTIVLTPVMVCTIVFGISPAILKHFGWYVARMPRPVR
jgi:hypothetical protein